MSEALTRFFYQRDEPTPPALEGLRPTPEEDAPGAGERFLTFLVGEGPSRLAAPVSGLLQVLRMPPLTPVPRAPEGVRGAVIWEGQALLVLDLWGGAGLGEWLVVLTHPRGPVGLSVQRLGAVQAGGRFEGGDGPAVLLPEGETQLFDLARALGRGLWSPSDD